jgi:hypothetical protein
VVREVLLSVVQVVVVLVAEQDEVVQVGQSAVGPVPDVVGDALGGGSVAALDDASAVADDQGAPLGGGDDAGGPSDVERVGAAGAQDDQVDGGVAGQSAQCVAGQRALLTGDARGGRWRAGQVVLEQLGQ